jgi:hypothetical protein
MPIAQLSKASLVHSSIDHSVRLYRPHMQTECHADPSEHGWPPNHISRHYTSFQHRAKSWSKARRVVAKVEFCLCKAAHTSITSPSGQGVGN